MATISKSLSGDFSGNLKINQFHTELGANVITANVLGGNFQYISKAGDDVDIVFGNLLNTPETNAVNALISAHVPDYSKPRKQHFKVYPETRKNKSANFKSIATFHWPGSKTLGTIDYIDIIARKHSNVTSYDLEIVDINNNNTIVSKTCSNDDMSCVNLGTIANIPEDSAIFEIRVKRNGGNNSNKVFIEEVQIYYGN